MLAGNLDPTIPISVDTKGRPGYGEQFTYGRFELLGVNQYFGWYRWVENFDDLEPFIYEQRDHYPKTAIVMTEFGAEALPQHAAEPVTRRGSYAFQTFHALRTLDVVDRSPVLSGAIYWTLREFEIYPGWTGGVGRDPRFGRNTRHNKGLVDLRRRAEARVLRGARPLPADAVVSVAPASALFTYSGSPGRRASPQRLRLGPVHAVGRAADRDGDGRAGPSRDA